MNWGYKLMFVFIAFAGLMATLVYKSTQTKYELVSKDYYKDELKYQDRIDAKYEASKISDVSILIEKDSILIKFPKELITSKLAGDFWFYCKTDETKDKHINFSRNALNNYSLPISTVKKGSYQIKINYKANNTQYFSEKEIVIK